MQIEENIQMVRFIIIFSLTMLIFGIFYSKLEEWGIGSIPGDFLLEKGEFKLYLPITTSILVSCLIQIILWFFNKE